MVRKFVVLLLVGLVGLTGWMSWPLFAQGAGPDGPTAPEIVGGQPADPGEYPWQAMVKGYVSATSYYQCGGSLIHQGGW